MKADDILDAVKERIDHPFAGVFLISVIICNFEAFVVIFIGDIDILKAINHVKSNLISFHSLITFPVLITISYIILSQWVMYLIDNLQLKPLEYRHKFKIKKEIKESETRKRLMKIEEEELVLQKEIVELKKNVHSDDVTTYKASQRKLSTYLISSLKTNASNNYVDKEHYTELVEYRNISFLGEFHFRNNEANVLHSALVSEINELINTIDQTCFTTSASRHYDLRNSDHKDILMSSVNNVFIAYNKYNEYIKNSIL